MVHGRMSDDPNRNPDNRFHGGRRNNAGQQQVPRASPKTGSQRSKLYIALMYLA
jgi:hypothetical protein